jgi:hypothetical protein
MRTTRSRSLHDVTALFVIGWLCLSLLCGTSSVAQTTANVAVGPQYDTTHVYVSADVFDHFVSSVIATFGGTTSKEGVFTVTPTPSETMSQLVLTPVGTLSVFGFKTPIPFPFGVERTGYLVTDIDLALRTAHAAGADIVVAPFNDPVGRDAIIEWPGCVHMQLYWHTTAPSYEPLRTIPENRVYVSPDTVGNFVRGFLRFSHGKVLSDDRRAPGIEIGRPPATYRRVRIESQFGRMVVLVTDGHIPFPYGRETTGYEVSDLSGTLSKGAAAGVSVLVSPYKTDEREAVIVQFPGGYIAEIHSPLGKQTANDAVSRPRTSERN